jgi:Rrf2 family protein
MLTRTGEYALRALIHLTRNEKDWPIAGRQIAEQAGIPAKYLSTILSQLVRTKVLTSARGLRGGFRLVRPTRKTFLFEILEPFEPVLTLDRPCPFGNTTCSDDDPCLGHEAWQGVREGYYRFLRKTSIFDVSIGQEKKKRRRTRTKSRR